MVYSSRFVLAVLVDGKPQKELANGTVPLQFGKEYALRFRNKNDRRAVVKFTIDGENVSGNGYIIPANGSVDIQRHWNKDAKFRFVDLDSPEAVDHGKNGPNYDGSKGVIEAKFYLEKSWPPPPANVVHHHHWHEKKETWPPLNNPYVPPPQWSTNAPPPPVNMPPAVLPCCTTSHDIPKSIHLDASNIPNKINCIMPPTSIVFGASPQFGPMQPSSQPAPLQEGCTVEGGRSGQTFTSEHIDLETDFALLRCILKGLPNCPVFTPPSTEASYCTQCGAKKTRPADNFCGVCGKKF